MIVKLEDLIVYQLAMEIGADIYMSVVTWPYFDKETLGKQIVRSADSLALNIAEGYGRFHYKENKTFCFYSRGSLLETRTSLIKSRERNLIEENLFANIHNKLEHFHKLLNGYIKALEVQLYK